MSLELVKEMFFLLSSINLCPCRPLEEEIRGMEGMLQTAAHYVQKDLVYHKEHARLKSKAAAWEQAVSSKAPEPLLHGDEAAFWKTWICTSEQCGLQPQPTEPMKRFVSVSTRRAAHVKLMIRMLALLLAVVLAAGIVVSTVMAVQARHAKLQAENALATAEAAEAPVTAGLEATQKSMRLALALASSSFVNNKGFADEARIKFLHESLATLPAADPVPVNATLLEAGRQLLLKPYAYTSQVQPYLNTTVNIILAGASGPSPIAVWSMSWSPGGSLLAAGAHGSVIRVGYNKDGSIAPETIQVLSNHQNAEPVESLGWSADSLSLATATRSSELVIWRLEQKGWGNTTLSLASGEVDAVAWSPDGSWLAAGLYKKNTETVVFWPVHSNGAVDDSSPRYLDIKGEVETLAWSPDSQLLAVGTTQWEVAIWSVGQNGTWYQMQLLQGFSDMISMLAWSPDGLTLASGTWTGEVLLWNIASGGLFDTDSPVVWEDSSPESRVISLSWLQDSSQLAVSFESGRMQLLNVGKSHLLGPSLPFVSFLNSDDAVLAVAWSPDGSMIASASRDTVVRVWNVGPSGNDSRSESHVELQGHHSQVYSLAWSPDSTLLASGSDNSMILVWKFDLAGQLVNRSEPQTLFAADGAWQVWDLAWSPDGSRLAAGCSSLPVTVWRLASDGVLYAGAPQQLVGPGYLPSLSWHPDGSKLYSVSYDTTAQVWSMSDDGSVGTDCVQVVELGEQQYPHSVDVSPNGSLLAISLYSGTTRIYSIQEDGHISTDNPQVVPGLGGAVYDSAWSPDGSLLATASADFIIRLWHVLPNGTVLSSHPQELTGHRAWVNDLAWSPIGTYLASASDDSTFRVWKLLTVDSFQMALEELPIASWDLTSTELSPVVASLLADFEPFNFSHAG
eukprot:scaffold49346_cov16-Prasinocladus_malaysianus.AAC.1